MSGLLTRLSQFDDVRPIITQIVQRNSINYQLAVILMRNGRGEASPLRDLDDFFTGIKDGISGFFKNLFSKADEDSNSSSKDSDCEEEIKIIEKVRLVDNDSFDDSLPSSDEHSSNDASIGNIDNSLKVQRPKLSKYLARQSRQINSIREPNFQKVNRSRPNPVLATVNFPEMHTITLPEEDLPDDFSYEAPAASLRAIKVPITLPLYNSVKRLSHRRIS